MFDCGVAEQFRDNELFCAFLALLIFNCVVAKLFCDNRIKHSKRARNHNAHNINPIASKYKPISLTTHNKEHILSQHLMNTWQPQVVHNVIRINPRNPEVHSVEHNIKFFCLCHKNNNSLI